MLLVFVAVPGSSSVFFPSNAGSDDGNADANGDSDENDMSFSSIVPSHSTKNLR